ncbi:hypothetical protein PCO31110_04022 [Pandoraea communis]|uniref:Uncharacterized protein n=1 Tax=Pandoraea communis TaxID=2508297 RepID=A0A5E4XM83_9BURK|nr:hypothetical protein [Pandoraea communis]VVE37649.1 hypothetical protein PCO31110_04022 [Pandoraea communis]
MSNEAIPEDFPRDSTISTMPGYQPKIGVRRVEGKYIAGYTEDELRERYDECVRLSGQLASYCRRKMAEKKWGLDEAINRVESSVRAKVSTGEWKLSNQECEWMLEKMRKRLADESAAE